ncbi:LysR family transcriptional regulator [Bosea sp. PAMC 26642]|uniref:LysR family transcriptional regulator n=1 Tax=Bosea sp. (strain PAMC 26642) TaxID=1792307 RepID=UPI00076FE4D8|nr:LysR family transcriptional regulator [Bosea sp. PAMC 26642]AMJ61197.1 transcriptional regulator [Bosea sp. PAMC 26642]
MDVTELTTFMAVARSGGITAAAREIHTVQSNVTMRIRTLEDEIGLPLFERHSRGMSMTEAGERLLPYAERVLSLLAEAKVAARDDLGARGTLHLGAMETTAAVRLPPLLAEYHKAYPEVKLSLRTGPTADLLQAVAKREIDGAFVSGPIDHADIVATPAFEERLGLVTPAAIADLAGLREGAAAGLTVLSFKTGCSYRQRLEQVMARLGLPAYARLEFGTLDGILGCVAAGVGITLLPRAVVLQAAQRDGLRWHPIEDGDGIVQTLFIRRRDAYESHAARHFLGLIAPPTTAL